MENFDYQFDDVASLYFEIPNNIPRCQTIDSCKMKKTEVNQLQTPSPIDSNILQLSFDGTNTPSNSRSRSFIINKHISYDLTTTNPL